MQTSCPLTKKVKLSSTTLFACMQHCLITDSEEVMGLLFGYAESDQIVQIVGSISLPRKSKESDRVEFDEEKMIIASEYAEYLNHTRAENSHHKGSNEVIKVVGWYHSHPKITAPPSNIDLNNQYSQQFQGVFVGLIFSTFSNDKQNTQRINLIAFQTKLDDFGNKLPSFIPVEIDDLEGNIFSVGHELFQIGDCLLCEEKEASKSSVTEYSNINDLFINVNRQNLLIKVSGVLITTINCAFNDYVSIKRNELKFYDYLNKRLEERLKILTSQDI